MGIFNRMKEATKVLLGKAQTQNTQVVTVATPKETVPPFPVPAQEEDVQAAINIPKPVQVKPTTVAAPKPTVTRALPAYAVKHSKFKEFSDKHRQHQSAAIAACDGVNIGQISIPTGTGKSRIQEHLHLEDMLLKAETKTPGVYVIAAHRLALCKQLLTDLIELVAACHLPFDVVFVGSDRVDEDAIYEKHMAEDVSKKSTYVTATTKQAEIKAAVIAAHKDGRNVLIVSTYHSFNRLAVLSNISMVTYDEAHTIASSRTSDDNFEAHVKEVQDKGSIQRQFFFTATRKVSGDDQGMNDQSLYGPVLYEEPPIKMILAGEIVPPRIHRVTTADDGEFKNDTMLVKTIIDAFSEHRNAVHNASPLAKKLGAKLLVSAEGTPSVNHLRENDEFRGWCFRNKVRLFLFSSVLGNFMFDKDTWRFRKSNRDETIAAMQAMPLEEDAILVHIDILAEGIDLPAITGVLPFRELNLIKLLQTIGRGARLIPEDRKALYSGKVQPMEWNKMIKPYCWVIFPKLASSESTTMDATIKKVLEAYDAPKMEFSREDEYKGYPDPELDPITPRDETSRKDPETALLHTLEDLMIGATVQPPRTTLTSQLATVNPSLLIP
jgi:superfamily II DNA or RNA helicase